MATSLQQISNLLYPPECAGCRTPTDAPHGLCPDCWAATRFITGAVCGCCGLPLPTAGPDVTALCETCTTHPPAVTRTRAAVMYEGRGRDIILRFKHRDRLDLAPVLARWMARAAPDILARADVIVPVPLHWVRRLSRRSNQAAELARQPCLHTHATYAPNLLTRTRRTRSLKGLNPRARHEELRAAISVTPGQADRLRNRHVLLIDDVMTTGATLSACAEAAFAAGAAEVNALVVARVAREGFVFV